MKKPNRNEIKGSPQINQYQELENFCNMQDVYIEHLEAKLKHKLSVTQGLGRHHWGTLARDTRCHWYHGVFGITKNVHRYSLAYKYLTDEQRAFIDARYIEIVKQNEEDFRMWQMRRWNE